MTGADGVALAVGITTLALLTTHQHYRPRKAQRMTTTRHLWEIDHPYYCEPGNFFKNGQHTVFSSWQEFTEETVFATGDRDLNFLFRWDWRKPGHHDWDGAEQLLLFFVLQRKSFNCSVQIAVTEADEPAVRAFLEDCARTLRATWEPILGVPTA